MSLAVLLEAGPMLVTQAGVQASIVATLVPTTAEGLDRWLDAAVGGAVALVAAAVVPASPLRRPPIDPGLLDDSPSAGGRGDSVRDRDGARAEALQRARGTPRSLDKLSDAAQEGLDVLQSPLPTQINAPRCGTSARSPYPSTEPPAVSARSTPSGGRRQKP